jgi:hypothetical protein
MNAFAVARQIGDVKEKESKQTDRKEGTRNSSVRLSKLAKAADSLSSGRACCRPRFESLMDSRAGSVANAEYNTSEA